MRIALAAPRGYAHAVMVTLVHARASLAIEAQL